MSYTNSLKIKASQVLPKEESNIMYLHNYRKAISELNEMLLDTYKNHWYIAPMIVKENASSEIFSIDTEILIIHYYEPIDLIMVGKAISSYRQLQKK